MELDDLGEALDALIASDAARCGDSRSIEELHRLHSRLDAFVAEAAATFEAGEQWPADGLRRRRPGSA
jgi:hypothetical protein